MMEHVRTRSKSVDRKFQSIREAGYFRWLVPTSDSISAPTIATMPLFGDDAVPWQLEPKARRRRCTRKLARGRDKTLHEGDAGQWPNLNVGYSLPKVCRHGLKSRKDKPSKEVNYGKAGGPEN